METEERTVLVARSGTGGAAVASRRLSSNSNNSKKDEGINHRQVLVKDYFSLLGPKTLKNSQGAMPNAMPQVPVSVLMLQTLMENCKPVLRTVSLIG